ncbi:MAG: hypothetical protein QNK32_00510 [Porticoccus sp.]|nr:hypothetical protein [Porticoccus sp.]
MNIVLFTLVAIVLYLFSDWLLRQIEIRRGAPFKNRSIIYFVIIFVLTLGTFEVLQRFLQHSSGG